MARHTKKSGRKASKKKKRRLSAEEQKQQASNIINFENPIKFRENKYSVQYHDIKIFIQGVDVSLFLTEGFLYACLSRSSLITPVFSNFLLNFFSALSTLSPSLIGTIIMSLFIYLLIIHFLMACKIRNYDLQNQIICCEFFYLFYNILIMSFIEACLL